MKAIVVLLTLVLLGSGCTFQSVKAGPKRVIVSTHSSQPASAAPDLARTSSRGLAKERGGRPPLLDQRAVLSASTDVLALTYTVYHWNTTTSAWEFVESDNISKYTLSVDLVLLPSEYYRVVIEVDISATAPGTNVGVKKYGAQQDFYVDPDYDTYVDLVVQPSVALVFDPSSVVSGTPTTVKAFDPVAGTFSTPSFFTGALTTGPADKFFYGPDTKLYYFNKAANGVYLWPNINTPMGVPNLKISGATSFDTIQGVTSDTTVTIYAACADPNYDDTVWVVGSEAGEFYYYVLDISQGSPDVWRSSPITADLQQVVSGTITTVPTGIAVDTTYRDVYITYYSDDGTDVESAVLQYYQDAKYAQFPTDPTFYDSTSSIFTDVAWDQGKAWVALSPNATHPTLVTDLGTANILQFDDYLADQGLVAGAVEYDGSATLDPTDATQLVLPNRFLGPVQGTTLFLSQRDFYNAGTAVLSALDLDTADVVSY